MKSKEKFLFHTKVKVAQSCPTLCDQGLSSPWNSPDQNTGVGRLFLLQQIFPTQESNWGLLYCRWIHYQLSYQGSLNIRKVFKILSITKKISSPICGTSTSFSPLPVPAFGKSFCKEFFSYSKREIIFR